LAGGTDIKPITAHVDLLPTLVDLCRLSAPKGVVLDGKSLVPLLRGDDADWPERTLFVHHQGRFGQRIEDDRPIKYKDFAVMTGRWRLVGEELYDIGTDPGQRNDVAAGHPDVVAELTAAYEAWWSDISGRFDEYCPTVVGSPQQPRTVLTCQDWHGEVIPYNQQHVRAAVEANGFWDLEVAAAGEYEITLRRWPEELDLPIDSVLPPAERDPRKHDVAQQRDGLPSGAIPAQTARLKVGDFDQTVPVEAGAKCISFRVKLPAGPVHLQTWLTDGSGTSWGAYYVYVERP
jgi:arylsulfatase B